MATGVPGALAGWMSDQRWYANKGSVPALEEIGSWTLPSPDAGVQYVVHLLIDHAPGKPALYQVPLAYRADPLPGEHAQIELLEDGRRVYDAPHDPGFGVALLKLISESAEIDGDRMRVAGRGRGASGLVRCRVLAGEQSNTSIVLEGDGAPVICKVFRALHDGDNPDVELQSALAEAGSTAVPPAVGHVVGDWTDSGTVSGRAVGHLAFAQEFLPGARDGWVIALEAARAGRTFENEAAALGESTADVHARLAQALTTATPTPAAISATLEQMRARLALAIREAPAVAGYERALSAVLERAAGVAWPPLQRIHGDLHLGQVLEVPPADGHPGHWVIIDFEGEPLRPMRERRVLDCPLRDVAGMLRSFDYVAGTIAEEGGEATAWAAAARNAFLAGYGSNATDPVLLRAFELDKALYEAVYEARNRPGWLPIPVAAIAAIAAG